VDSRYNSWLPAWAPAEKVTGRRLNLSEAGALERGEHMTYPWCWLNNQRSPPILGWNQRDHVGAEVVGGLKVYQIGFKIFKAFGCLCFVSFLTHDFDGQVFRVHLCY